VEGVTGFASVVTNGVSSAEVVIKNGSTAEELSKIGTRHYRL
jgi:hypothetical protein